MINSSSILGYNIDTYRDIAMNFSWSVQSFGWNLAEKQNEGEKKKGGILEVL